MAKYDHITESDCCPRDKKNPRPQHVLSLSAPSDSFSLALTLIHEFLPVLSVGGVYLHLYVCLNVYLSV